MDKSALRRAWRMGRPRFSVAPARAIRAVRMFVAVYYGRFLRINSVWSVVRHNVLLEGQTRAMSFIHLFLKCPNSTP